MRVQAWLGTAVLTSALALAGCATPNGYGGYGQSYTSSQQYTRGETRIVQQVIRGRVQSVRQVAINRDGRDGPGLGAVLGVVAGGLLGNQIGHGSGRTLATVGGAVAGGFAGNAIQNNGSRRPGLEITVRLENGERVAVVQDADESFYPGDRVQLIGSGSEGRVVHDY